MEEGLGSSWYRKGPVRFPDATFLTTPGLPFSLSSLSGLLKPQEGSRTFAMLPARERVVPCVMFP